MTLSRGNPASRALFADRPKTVHAMLFPSVPCTRGLFIGCYRRQNERQNHHVQTFMRTLPLQAYATRQPLLPRSHSPQPQYRLRRDYGVLSLTRAAARLRIFYLHLWKECSHSQLQTTAGYVRLVRCKLYCSAPKAPSWHIFGLPSRHRPWQLLTGYPIGA